MEQAVKALGLVLQAGTSDSWCSMWAMRRKTACAGLPFTTWLRLQRMVEGSQTIGILAGDAPMSRSAAGLTLKLQPASQTPGAHAHFTGRLLDGLQVETRVARCAHAGDR